MENALMALLAGLGETDLLSALKAKTPGQTKVGAGSEAFADLLAQLCADSVETPEAAAEEAPQAAGQKKTRLTEVVGVKEPVPGLILKQLMSLLNEGYLNPSNQAAVETDLPTVRGHFPQMTAGQTELESKLVQEGETLVQGGETSQKGELLKGLAIQNQAGELTENKPERAPEKASEQALEMVSKQTLEKASEQALEMVSKQTLEKASEQAAEKVSEPAPEIRQSQSLEKMPVEAIEVEARTPLEEPYETTPPRQGQTLQQSDAPQGSGEKPTLPEGEPGPQRVSRLKAGEEDPPEVATQVQGAAGRIPEKNDFFERGVKEAEIAPESKNSLRLQELSRAKEVSSVQVERTAASRERFRLHREGSPKAQLDYEPPNPEPQQELQPKRIVSEFKQSAGQLYLGRHSSLVLLEDRLGLLKEMAKVRSEGEGSADATFSFSSLVPQETGHLQQAGGSEVQPEVVRGRFPQVLEQEVIKFSTGNTDGDSKVVKVKLVPAELGEVRVELILKEGKVSAHIQAQQEATRDLISANLSQLRAALQNQGVQLSEISLAQSASQMNWSGQWDRRSPVFERRERTRYQFEDDEEVVLLSQLPEIRPLAGRTGSYGLDLRM
ncbi:MAG: flagellar hook-length control protein FliK [Firmicutes bacterium]|nr:flagellar hook-length control protein FliK [Bacillota bacterium]